MAQAKQHFETGRNAYNAGDYVTAIREFKAAEELRPSPILDYNIGLANEKLGKRRVARQVLQALSRGAAERVEPGRGRAEGRGARGGDRRAAAAGGEQRSRAERRRSRRQAEQPSDMPPPDANAQPGARGAAGLRSRTRRRPPPGQPPSKPAKKKSLWWVGLIIGGAVTITVVIAVVVYVYAANDDLLRDARPRAADGGSPSGNGRASIVTISAA